jgi:hypothetical protein
LKGFLLLLVGGIFFQLSDNAFLPGTKGGTDQTLILEFVDFFVDANRNVVIGILAARIQIFVCLNLKFVFNLLRKIK